MSVWSICILCVHKFSIFFSCQSKQRMEIESNQTEVKRKCFSLLISDYIHKYHVVSLWFDFVYVFDGRIQFRFWLTFIKAKTNGNSVGEPQILPWTMSTRRTHTHVRTIVNTLTAALYCTVVWISVLCYVAFSYCLRHLQNKTRSDGNFFGKVCYSVVNCIWHPAVLKRWTDCSPATLHHKAI